MFTSIPKLTLQILNRKDSAICLSFQWFVSGLGPIPSPSDRMNMQRDVTSVNEKVTSRFFFALIEQAGQDRYGAADRDGGKSKGRERDSEVLTILSSL